MIEFTMGRFNPEKPERPEEVRTIVADTEDEVYERLDDPFDGSYWATLSQQSQQKV